MESGSARWIRAAVRYWGGSLSLVRSKDSGQWPGFHYEEAERKQLDALAEQVGLGELALFLLLNSLVFIAMAGLVVVAGFIPLVKAMFPVASETPALPVFGLLGLLCALMAGIGVPLSLVISAGLLSKLYQHPPLPEPTEAQIVHLFLKMQRQCLRAGLAVTIVGLVGACVLAYYERRIDMLWQVGLRFVLPALSTSGLMYFFSRRLAKGE